MQNDCQLLAEKIGGRADWRNSRAPGDLNRNDPSDWRIWRVPDGLNINDRSEFCRGGGCRADAGSSRRSDPNGGDPISDSNRRISDSSRRISDWSRRISDWQSRDRNRCRSTGDLC